MIRLCCKRLIGSVDRSRTHTHTHTEEHNKKMKEVIVAVAFCGHNNDPFLVVNDHVESRVIRDNISRSFRKYLEANEDLAMGPRANRFGGKKTRTTPRRRPNQRQEQGPRRKNALHRLVAKVVPPPPPPTPLSLCLFLRPFRSSTPAFQINPWPCATQSVVRLDNPSWENVRLSTSICHRISIRPRSLGPERPRTG